MKTKKLWCPVCKKKTIQVRNVRTGAYVCSHQSSADMETDKKFLIL